MSCPGLPCKPKRWIFRWEAVYFMKYCADPFVAWQNPRFFKVQWKCIKIRLMEEFLHQLRLVVCPITYRVSYIPGGARFLPSTVLSWSKHVWLLALYRANIGQELYIENHASTNCTICLGNWLVWGGGEVEQHLNVFSRSFLPASPGAYLDIQLLVDTSGGLRNQL